MLSLVPLQQPFSSPHMRPPHLSPQQFPDGECCPAAFHQHCLTPPVGEIPIHKWFCPACIRDVAMGLWRGGCGDGYRHESRVGPCFQVASASLPAPRARYQLSPDRGRGGVKVPLVVIEAERQLERSSAPVAVSPSDRSARVARGSHSSTTAAARPAATAAAPTTSLSTPPAEPTGQDLPLLKKRRGRPPKTAPTASACNGMAPRKRAAGSRPTGTPARAGELGAAVNTRGGPHAS